MDIHIFIKSRHGAYTPDGKTTVSLCLRLQYTGFSRCIYLIILIARH